MLDCHGMTALTLGENLRANNYYKWLRQAQSAVFGQGWSLAMNYERRQSLHSIGGNEYTWNEFGVCLSPKVIIDWRVKGGYLEIKIAQKDNGKYVYGFCLDYSTGFQGFSPNVCDDGYKCESEAKEAALLYARKCIENAIEWHMHVRMTKNTKALSPVLTNY